MNRLQKIGLHVGSTLLAATPLLALAESTSTTSTSIVSTTLNTSVAATGLGATNFQTIILAGIQVILGLLAIIVLILIIYAGILWMTAGGSEEKVQKAQGIIKNAIIGLVIIMSSWGIVLYLASALSAATGTKTV